MEIFFLLTDEPFYTPLCCRRILERWAPHVVGVAFSPGFWRWRRIRATLQVYGPLVVLARGLRVVLANLRGGVVRRQFAGHSVQIYPVRDVNSPAFRELLTGLDVNLLVSLNCPQKLRAELIRVPRLGCVNVHFGLLPRYRGILPIMYAILNDEREFGVTVHYMDEKLDNGDIILQGTVPIGPTDILETLYPKAFELAGDLISRAFGLIESGTAIRLPNPEAAATYYSYPSRDIARRYRRLARQRRRLRSGAPAVVASVGTNPRPN